MSRHVIEGVLSEVTTIFSSSPRIITQRILNEDIQPISPIHLHGKAGWLQCIHSFTHSLIHLFIHSTGIHWPSARPEPDVTDITISKKDAFPEHLPLHGSLHCPALWNLSENKHKAHSFYIQYPICPISKVGSQGLLHINQNVSTERKKLGQHLCYQSYETGSKRLKIPTTWIF